MEPRDIQPRGPAKMTRVKGNAPRVLYDEVTGSLTPEAPYRSPTPYGHFQCVKGSHQGPSWIRGPISSKECHMRVIVQSQACTLLSILKVGSKMKEGVCEIASSVKPTYIQVLLIQPAGRHWCYLTGEVFNPQRG